MAEKVDLNEEQTEEIAQVFIKGNINWFEYSKEFYRNAQNIAYQLGFFKLSEYERRGGYDKLSEDSFKLVYDKIWKYIVEGYIAPGKNYLNPWFPHCHLTKEGEEYRDELLQEEDTK